MTGGLASRVTALARVRPVSFYGLSLALHAALGAMVLLAPPTVERRATPVSVEIIESRPAAAEAERPRPEPPPEPRPVLRPDRRAAKVPRPRLPEDAPPPASREAPPPPNAPPSATAKPGPIRIGISMSSTTTAGEYAAPSGNSLYGAPERSGDPQAGGPRASERYSPPSQVTSLPEPLGCDIPKSEYPEEARRLGIEGEVKLQIVIDQQGGVKEARVVRDPGHGFGPVAQRSVKTYCRFRPARKNGETVATEIPYTIRFEL